MSKKVTFVGSRSPNAVEALAMLSEKYDAVDLDDAEIIVALGGDGYMLEAIHRNMKRDLPIYGMNRGTVGFLLNSFETDDLMERLEKAQQVTITPLHMKVTTDSGIEQEAYAFNEVSLLRQTRQAANLRVTIDGKTRIETLMCDGCLVATPAGSTAYNLSAHGPTSLSDQTFSPSRLSVPFDPGVGKVLFYQKMQKFISRYSMNTKDRSALWQMRMKFATSRKLKLALPQKER